MRRPLSAALDDPHPSKTGRRVARLDRGPHAGRLNSGPHGASHAPLRPAGRLAAQAERPATFAMRDERGGRDGEAKRYSETEPSSCSSGIGARRANRKCLYYHRVTREYRLSVETHLEHDSSLSPFYLLYCENCGMRGHQPAAINTRKRVGAMATAVPACRGAGGDAVSLDQARCLLNVILLKSNQI